MEANEEIPRFQRRVEHYLGMTLRNPGKYVHIRPKKGLSSLKAIHNERDAVVERIGESLSLAGIKSERRGRYSIRVCL